jgi:hypothetical protein
MTGIGGLDAEGGDAARGSDEGIDPRFARLFLERHV